MNRKERREFEVEQLVMVLENYIEAVITNKQSEHIEDASYLNQMRNDLIQALLERLP
jgi:hypothetical protein